jgi:hypothetical protein
MNIKKIIREEMDDFEWINQIDPHSFIKQYYEKYDDEYRVKKMLDDYAHLRDSKKNIYDLINKFKAPSYLDVNLLRKVLIKYYKENLPLVKRFLSRFFYDDLNYEAQTFIEDLSTRFGGLNEGSDDFDWIKDISNKKHSYGVVLLEKDYQLIYIEANDIQELWSIYYRKYGKGLDPMLYSVDGRVLPDFRGLEPKVDIARKIHESNDFEWIESEENPWSDIPEETINQLTEEEKKLILYIMDSETYWNKRQGCEPKYKIDDIEFDEYDNWFGGFNHGLKRKIKLCFTTTCDNQTYNNKTYLCATIDRNNLDYHVA